MLKDFGEQYIKILKNFLEDESESCLYQASLFSKELINKGIRPEEIVETHLKSFKELLKSYPYCEWVQKIYKSFSLLIEIMTFYGNVYKEYLELKDNLLQAMSMQVAYKRLQVYVDEIEFITQRLALINEELDRKVMELGTLHKISKAINSDLNFDRLLNQILVCVKEVIDYEDCYIYLMEDQSTKLALIKHYESAVGQSEAKLNILQQVNQLVLSKKENQVVDLGTQTWDHACSGTGTLLAIPMLVENRILGILSIITDQKKEIIDELLEMLSIVASHAAIAIKNATDYEYVKKTAITDGLTGLFNHRYFYERFKRELDWSKHHELPVSLLMIDIDNFKEYNDIYGHVAGDKLLKIIADILRFCTRDEDVIARYGGDEFAVVLMGVAKKAACKIADRIRVSIGSESCMDKNGNHESVNVSVGVSSFPEDALTVGELVNIADKALYISKKNGKNQVSFINVK